MSDTKLKVITPLAILSYPHVAAPQKSNEPGKKDKYSASLVFTPETLAIPSEKELFDKLVAAAMAAIDAKWPGKRDMLMSSESFKKGFRRDAESKGYPKGSIFINARTEQQPGCVYPFADPQTGKAAKVPVDKLKETFFPGAIVRGSVTAFGYENSGNKGVSFALNNLQFIKAGERIDGRIAAEDEFTADLSSTPSDLDALLS